MGHGFRGNGMPYRRAAQRHIKVELDKMKTREKDSDYREIIAYAADVLYHVQLPLSKSELFQLVQQRYPRLSWRRFSNLLLIKAICAPLIQRIGQRLYHAPSIVIVMTNCLIQADYQRLGMRLFPGKSFHNEVYIPYVPAAAEHRFFSFAPSTIPRAGLGLFLRPGRRLRTGTIACEYRGRVIKTRERLGCHTVQLQDGLRIDGVDEAGHLLSWAPLMNDNGPERSNVRLIEVDEAPGRIFVITTRDLTGPAELFVPYGPDYWGAASYDQALMYGHAPSVFDEGRTSCPLCGEQIPSRVLELHQMACGDPLTLFRPHPLDPLPRSPLTCQALDTPQTTETRAEAVTFVTNSYTLSNTHDICCVDI